MTSLYIDNKSIFQLLDPASQLLEPVRVMAANRLARSGKEWTEMMAQHNGGTYNNQWMVIDYTKLGTDGSLAAGALWVYEQMPGQTWAEDKTDELRRTGYWVSYNRAFYPEVFKMSGGENMTSLHGDYFSYRDTPRAKIMRREQAMVVSEETMISFMRFNDFQNDPAALVEGCNKPIPAGSVANRCRMEHSHWSRPVQILCSDWLRSYPIKTQLKAPKVPRGISCRSLCLYGIRM